MNSIFQLAYISNAAINFKEQQLSTLLQKARQNNKKNNLTGILLYLESHFLQVLEGDLMDVLTTYNKIKEDLRHSEVVILYENVTNQRSFENWSMGLKTMNFSTYRELTGWKDISESNALRSLVPKQNRHIMPLLESFYHIYN